MKRILFLSILLVSSIWTIQAQEKKTLLDTLSTKVYFPINRPELYFDFKNNERNLQEFVKELKVLKKMDAINVIKISAGASPDGPHSFNKELAKNRGESIRRYIRERVDIPEEMFAMTSLGADWDGLVELIEDADIEYKQELLHILKEYNPKDRIPAIRKLGQGSVWRILKKDYLPVLRAGQTIAVEVIVEKIKPQPEPVKEEPVVTTPVVEEPVAVVEPDPCKPFYMNLRTNMLYDLALTPNIGIEFYTAKGWSILGNYYGAWWHNDNIHYYWRLYGGDLEVRKYFGKAATEKPLTGHHLGIYGQVGSFDFEFGKKGYLAKLVYGGGISYGYSLPITRRLNIDFTIGAGYLHGDYDIYHPYFPNGKDGCYEWLETRTANWILPTKAEITLVWQIGCDNINRKKGGRK